VKLAASVLPRHLDTYRGNRAQELSSSWSRIPIRARGNFSMILLMLWAHRPHSGLPPRSS
jgi:hypothetical protein